MKKLLSLLGAVSLTATTSSVVACKPSTKEENDKIIIENINNTSLENIVDSTKLKKSNEAENKISEFQEKEAKYRNKFENDRKDINFQLLQLFSLRKEEAFYKTYAVKFGKLNELPPADNDTRQHLYNKIQEIKKEKKINNLIVKLAIELENKYYK